MGITQKSLDRFNKYVAVTDNMLILGCQNMYNTENYLDLAHDYFTAKGFNVRTIDILGCQGSEPMDLREDLNFGPDFGIILQHGTIEHIDGSLYRPFKNIHEACANNGLMIHENPKTENWPGHGYHYFTENFFKSLSKACNYTLLEINSEPAMGNVVDGWNICAVIEKSNTDEFISEKDFNKIYLQHIKQK